MTALAAVVAMDRDGLIGKNGVLPWPRLPRDRRRFRALTIGYPVIMGRKTWDSLPAPPLPGRANIVLSRCQDLRGRGAYLARDVDEVLESLRCLSDGRASVIGGAEVFAAFLPFCRKIHLTLLDGEFPGDTFFPGGVPGPPDWHVTDPQWHEADEENPLGMTFQTLVREPARRSLDE